MLQPQLPRKKGKKLRAEQERADDGPALAPQPQHSGKKKRKAAAVEEQDSGFGSRPERTGAAERFYGRSEAAKYEQNSRMATTQRHLAERALHLLELKPGVPALLLDVGCGTGYSGRPLEKAGHTWIGTDISENMLAAARAPTRQRDVVCADVGIGLGYRKGVFDGAVSISAVQWLCVATRPEHDPLKRCSKFFRGLHAVLAPHARAALQVYPEEPSHMGMLRDAALAAGFEGGLVIDYPVSERSKKMFLVLVAKPRPLKPQRAPKAGGGKGKGKGKGKGGGGKGGGKGKGGGGKRKREE
jgi:18S rRNA (guanine1575-N7)-methyltransferase